MRRTASLAWLVVVLLMVVMVFSKDRDPHAFTHCNTCHQTDSANRILEHQMTAGITLLCSDCHLAGLSEGYMHPVDVKPRSVIIPKDMRLSPVGELTCATCHDVHSGYETAYGAPSHYLRRGESGKEFCRICHPEASGRSSGHQTTLGEAHFKSRYISTSASQEIDAVSKNCISCHDGSSSPSASVMAGVWVHRNSLIPHDQGGHPIGVDYESARLKQGRTSDLRPLISVDRRIRFFSGKIGCGSCHDPYSDIEKGLVMSDRKSRLCLACHILEG